MEANVKELSPSVEQNKMSVWEILNSNNLLLRPKWDNLINYNLFYVNKLAKWSLVWFKN